jgi:cobalamin biosynthetic protein CobC
LETKRDHGGGLDAAIAHYGGERIGWIDLSTGINPCPYPTSGLTADVWSALPDSADHDALITAARRFWAVPGTADILAAAGASALIAQIPGLLPPGGVAIPGPTYNEHEAAFRAHGWDICETARATAQVVVHPNNPDGKQWSAETLRCSDRALTVIDESFCDVAPDQSCMDLATRPGVLVLKSFGKFWGLAGLRLGFAIGDPDLIGALRQRLGPWSVSGPALRLGSTALRDADWARKTRVRLCEDSARLDALMRIAGARTLGGTTLFRLYDVNDAAAWQDRLAKRQIWSRVFPYNPNWLRLGLPHPLHWARLETALK